MKKVLFFWNGLPSFHLRKQCAKSFDPLFSGQKQLANIFQSPRKNDNKFCGRLLYYHSFLSTNLVLPRDATWDYQFLKNCMDDDLLDIQGHDLSEAALKVVVLVLVSGGDRTYM